MDNLGSGSYRQTAKVGHDGTIQNVAYNYGTDRQRTFPLPLHADRAYLKSQPEIMWFLCARPAESGGQTTICDGVAVVPALSASTRRLFESKRLKYIRHYAEDQWKLLYRTNDLDQVRRFCEQNDLRLHVNEDRSVRTEFLAPAIRKTKWGGTRAFCNSLQIGIWQEKHLGRSVNFVRLEDNSEIPDEVLAEIDEVTESLTENIPWSSGDLAIVDNTRMLHGRRAFNDPAREVYVRMCQSVSW